MDVALCLQRLPKKLKIGAYDWRVVLEEGDDKHGEADFEFHILKLWPTTLRSPAHVVGILLHECLHVIFDNEDLLDTIAGIRVHNADDDEETIVVGFEQGLVSLFRDNPKLLTWIKKCLK